MGRPLHYSAEVPARCVDLIEKYGPLIEADKQERWGGPLKTTFLLAMATPMLILPMERIFKALEGSAGPADDVALDPSLDARVKQVFAPEQTFGAAPFWKDGGWRYVPNWEPFNVGAGWPPGLLDTLGENEAEYVARRAPARNILTCLRNALAHGGVTYLDSDGRQAQFDTHMLGFASWAVRGKSPRLAVLRVTVPGFEAFLKEWASWLKNAGVADRLEAEGPTYFNVAAE